MGLWEWAQRSMDKNLPIDLQREANSGVSFVHTLLFEPNFMHVQLFVNTVCPPRPHVGFVVYSLAAMRGCIVRSVGAVTILDGVSANPMDNQNTE